MIKKDWKKEGKKNSKVLKLSWQRTPHNDRSFSYLVNNVSDAISLVCNNVKVVMLVRRTIHILPSVRSLRRICVKLWFRKWREMLLFLQTKMAAVTLAAKSKEDCWIVISGIFIPFTKKRITKTNPFKKLWVSENGLNVSSSQKITLPYCSNTNATYYLRRQENAFVIKNSTREKPGHEPSRKKTEIRHRPQTSFLQITSASGKQKFLKKRLEMLRVMLKTLNSGNL